MNINGYYYRMKLFFGLKLIYFLPKSINYIPNSKEKKPLSWFNFIVASPEGFEPSTARLEGVCSIQLSYEDS